VNPHGYFELIVLNSGPSLVQEINSIKELRVHIPCINKEMDFDPDKLDQ